MLFGTCKRAQGEALASSTLAGNFARDVLPARAESEEPGSEADGSDVRVRRPALQPVGRPAVLVPLFPRSLVPLFPRSLVPSVPCSLVFLLRVEGCANLKFCAVYAESWSVSAHFSASRDGFPWVERFHNLLALAGVVQGGFFLRKKPLERRWLRGAAIVKPLVSWRSSAGRASDL